MPKFQHIDHTADVGIKVYASDLPALFEYAAEGLFDIITDLSRVQPNLSRTFQLDASDREALLVRWLSELNYFFLTQHVLFKTFRVQLHNDTSLTATARGEPLDRNKHEIYTEVKAVTYHGLYIKRVNQVWEAQIIFDL